MESWQKQLLGERQRRYRGVRGSRAPKKWLTIRGSEKIKDVEDWVLLRSWYEFDGLLSEEAEFVWLVFWACCMFPRMGGYTKERMRLFVALTRVFMFAYEQFAGILRTPVSYMKNLFKPYQMMRFGPPSYNSELQSDNCFKFLMDVLRRCLMNGNPEKVRGSCTIQMDSAHLPFGCVLDQIMLKAYLRATILAHVKHALQMEKVSRYEFVVSDAFELLRPARPGTASAERYGLMLEFDFIGFEDEIIEALEDAPGFDPAVVDGVVSVLQRDGIALEQLQFFEKMKPADMPEGRFFNTCDYDQWNTARLASRTGSSPRVGSNCVVMRGGTVVMSCRFMSFFALSVTTAQQQEVRLAFAHVHQWEQRDSHPEVADSCQMLQIFHNPPVRNKLLLLRPDHFFEQLQIAAVIYSRPKVLSSGRLSKNKVDIFLDPSAVVGMLTSTAPSAALERLTCAFLRQREREMRVLIPPDPRALCFAKGAKKRKGQKKKARAKARGGRKRLRRANGVRVKA
jgi:hypothetical protein